MLLLSLLLLAQTESAEPAAPPEPAPRVIRPIDPANIPTIMAVPLAPPPPDRYVVPVPRGNPGRWITSDDYPDIAYFGEHEGVVSFHLDVAADGRVSACSITRSDATRELERATCSLFTRRARFTPASMNDQPTTGSFDSRVRWAFPKDIFFLVDPAFDSGAASGPALTAAAGAWIAGDVYPAAARERPSGRTIVILDVNAGGQVTNCTVDQPSGVAPLDDAACPLLTGKTLFDAATDADGKSVAARARIKLRWEPPAAS